MKCWCGVVGTQTELFAEYGLEPDCGGWGHRICRCGGDQCVCHHHGQVECEGCPECQPKEVFDVAGG